MAITKTQISPRHEEELYVEGGRSLEKEPRGGLESSSPQTFKTHLDAFQNREVIQVILSYIPTHM